MSSLIYAPSVEPYTPADWQLDDLRYLADRDWSANWSDTGCYKTTTLLWHIENRLKNVENPRVLIVTTNGGKGTYFDAIPKVLPDWTTYSIQPLGAGKCTMLIAGEQVKYDIQAPFVKEHRGPCIILATYHCFTVKAQVRKLFESIKKYDFIAIDEAHRIKETDNQWTKNLKRLKATNRHAMTANGFINRPDEIWSILNFLKPEIYSSYWAFRRTFCDEYRDDASGMTVILGVKPERLEDFRNMRKTIGPRRYKNGPEGVFEGILERPVVTNYPVELNSTQRKMYDEIKTNLATMDQQGVPIYSPNVLSQLNRLRQICVATPEKYGEYYDEKAERLIQQIRLVEPSTKLDAVMDILDSMEWDDENKQQVVIFSNFKDPLQLLKVRLDRKQIPYMHMETPHNPDERYKMWHDIFPTKEHRVFMSTLQLGGESINLTPAETCIFLDRSWSPKDNEQGVGRLYRPGQTKIPQIIHINARGTTDQRIEKKNEQKMGWFNEIFGEDQTNGAG